MDKFDPTQFKETVGLKEEITDIVEGIHARYSEENFKKLRIKKGRVLRFDYEGSKTTIRITKVANGRYWGEHIELHDQRIVRSHTRHDVDTDQKPPFCRDCQVPVTQPSTEDGEKKYQDREDRQLSDGTIIDQPPAE
jgi:hypothetical protein